MMRSSLFLLLLAGPSVLSASICPNLVAISGNYTFVYNDHRPTYTWLSHVVEPTTPTGNLTTAGEPLLLIPDFKLCEVGWGGAVTAHDAANELLYVLGEVPVNPNSSTAGPLQLAVVDLKTYSVKAIHRNLPVVNKWQKIPLDDDDGHDSTLSLWGGKLVLLGPTTNNAGDSNYTAFVLDMASSASSDTLKISAQYPLPLEFTEMPQGPSAVDASGSLHFMVDRVYAGQRIYHVKLSTGDVSVTDVPPAGWYWMNFVMADNALYGAAQFNDEGASRRAPAVRDGKQWMWTKYDLATQTFSNRSLGGEGCIPIMNPEDNTQNMGGVLPGGDLAFVGMSCQPDNGDIIAAVGVVDFKSGFAKSMWPFAGLYNDGNIGGLLCLQK